jgi:Ca2+/Na+ antiporter
LYLDEKTLSIGLPVLLMATVLFIISGISRRIHVQEGAMYLLLYIVFITKLFGLF